MSNRDSWGPSYLTVGGEVFGSVEDGLLRKHLPRMSLLGARGSVVAPSMAPAEVPLGSDGEIG